MYPIEKYNFKHYEKTNDDGSVSQVIIALSTYAGKIVKGVAKCRAGDDYNLEDGKRLAAARCDFKVCNKRLNRARKKKTEIMQQLEKLNKAIEDANSYYEDALNATVEALNNVKNIENSLK